METLCDLLDEASEILPGRDRADGAGEHVVEEKGGDGKLGETAAHGRLDYAVNTTADEHGAGFDIKRSDGGAEQHHRKNEPGSALAYDLLRIAGDVVGGRCQVGEDDGGGAPEGDEGQHHRGGDEDLYCRF